MDSGAKQNNAIAEKMVCFLVDLHNARWFLCLGLLALALFFLLWFWGVKAKPLADGYPAPVKMDIGRVAKLVQASGLPMEASPMPMLGPMERKGGSEFSYLFRGFSAEDLARFDEGARMLTAAHDLRTSREPLEIFDKLREKYPDSLPVAFNEAYALALGGDYDKAVQTLRLFLRETQGQESPAEMKVKAVVHYATGLYLYRLGRYEPNGSLYSFRRSIYYLRALAGNGAFGSQVRRPYDQIKYDCLGIEFRSLYAGLALCHTYQVMGKLDRPASQESTFCPSNTAEGLYQDLKGKAEANTLHLVAAADNYRSLYCTMAYRDEPRLLLSMGVFAAGLGRYDVAAKVLVRGKTLLSSKPEDKLFRPICQHLLLAYMADGQTGPAMDLIRDLTGDAGQQGPAGKDTLQMLASALKQGDFLARWHWSEASKNWQDALANSRGEADDIALKVRKKLWEQALAAYQENLGRLSRDGNLAELATLTQFATSQEVDREMRADIAQATNDGLAGVSLPDRLKLWLGRPLVHLCLLLGMIASLAVIGLYLAMVMAFHLRYRRTCLVSGFQVEAGKRSSIQKIIQEERDAREYFREYALKEQYHNQAWAEGEEILPGLYKSIDSGPVGRKGRKARPAAANDDDSPW